MSMAGNAGPSLVPRQARIVVASARIGRTGSVGGFFDLLADLLHVLGGTLHRVAGKQEVGGKQREQGKGDDALHGTILYEWGGPQGKSAARVVNETPSRCECRVPSGGLAARGRPGCASRALSFCGYPPSRGRP